MKVFQSLEGYGEGTKTNGKRLRYVPEKDREEIFENYFRILSDEPWLNCTDIKHCTALEYQLLAEKIWADMAFVLPAFEHALLYSDKSAFVAVYYLNVDMKKSQIEYPIPGAGHAEDIMFMLDVPSMELKLNGKSTSLWEILHSPPSNPYRPEEYMYHMVDIFVNHWASIIKHGHPASPWPQFEREYKHFVEWTNNATHAIEKVHSKLPPTIEFMIDTYGSLGSSATVISSSLFALFFALLF
ncbi:Oidioi.mRNA.OKI2018_I69.XSR.g16591.t1.cds [Oikopleura dioica]|uniref:Oidioi.mRNA.OKI2018_I69.XSR.g16591.t1.cds n=1 Tax=Oikopleura dioica TaxID=34765 RepID=A0ABN7SKL0_OIKDI|nr:Oidioi.mRNA.OKI2018_I69.XSR.g16591.t1.cds [Oikopleura dioica]